MKVERKENHTLLEREKKKNPQQINCANSGRKMPSFSFIFLMGGYDHPSPTWSLIFKVKELKVNGSMRNKIRIYKVLNLYVLSLTSQRW